MKKERHPQQPPHIFSEDFDWPVKILYALAILKEGTAAEVADFIVEQEGDAAQERVAEVNSTVKDYLEAMQKKGKIKYSTTLPHDVQTYKLPE